MNKYELKRITNAIASLSDSTSVSALFPGGVRVDVWGRNGLNPEWAVSVQEGILSEAGVTLDNGKYSIIISNYEIDFSRIYFGDNVDVLHVVLPRAILQGLLRGIYQVFILNGPESLIDTFFYMPVVNVYLLGRKEGGNKYVKVL